MARETDFRVQTDGWKSLEQLKRLLVEEPDRTYRHAHRVVVLGRMEFKCCVTSRQPDDHVIQARRIGLEHDPPVHRIDRTSILQRGRKGWLPFENASDPIAMVSRWLDRADSDAIQQGGKVLLVERE